MGRRFRTFSPQRPDHGRFGLILSAVVYSVRFMTSTAPPSAPTDPVAARIRAVADSLAALAEPPVWALDDAALDARVAEAARLAASAQEMLARTVGEADAAGLPGRAGATSTRAWLTGHHGMSARDASRSAAQARAMTPAAEPTRLAWARGELCGDRAEAVAHAVNNLPDGVDPKRVEAAQAGLLARSRTLSFAELRSEAARLVDAVDPDRLRAETQAEREPTAYERSTFRLRKGLDGLASFSGTMPNLAADMLLANLDAIASPRRDHLRDGADKGTDADGQVPYASRLGRAFCDLVEKVDARGLRLGDGVNATLVVTVDEHDLRDRVGSATLSSGDEITVSEARRLACSADILPAVLDGESRVLDLGRTRRLFSPAQKTALAVRDGGCAFAECERPPGWTEAHHVDPWSAGGKTDLDNAVLLCGAHHRLIHKEDGADGWQIQIAADGIPETVPPRRVDPQRTPIRHSRHRQRPRRPDRRRDRRRPRPEAA
jgi:hypothetical protein